MNQVSLQQLRTLMATLVAVYFPRAIEAPDYDSIVGTLRWEFEFPGGIVQIRLTQQGKHGHWAVKVYSERPEGSMAEHNRVSIAGWSGEFAYSEPRPHQIDEAYYQRTRLYAPVYGWPNGWVGYKSPKEEESADLARNVFEGFHRAADLVHQFERRAEK